MLRSFPKGGVHPPENKLSAGSKITVLDLPKTVNIPLSQSLGVPAVATVKRGDLVKTGQLIAEHKGFVSSNIHSPVTGKVVKFDKSLDSSGYKRNAIIIEAEADSWMDGIDTDSSLIKDFSYSSEEIVKKILEGGIVGMGGATFPTHVKMSLPRGKKADVVILNGVECEPYLTSDHRLMLEKGEEIIVGLRLFMKALNVNKGIIGKQQAGCYQQSNRNCKPIP